MKTRLRFYDGPTLRPLLCHLRLHRWVIARRLAFTVYSECARCGERRVEQEEGQYRIDWEWVRTGEWEARKERAA